MALYDTYQLANSTRVPIYQGSTVPELAQVSQEMQKRYDTAQAEQDYVSRFMNSMQALPSDQPALRAMSQEYRDKLKALSSRPDLENTLRETSMLAQTVPAAYAPFAQRMKDYQSYSDQLQKAVAAGDITPDTAKGMLAMSLYKDPGVSKNPETGQWEGRFVGQDYTKDIDPEKFVDDAMKDAFPDSEGFTREKIGNQWIIKDSQGKVMSPDRIKSVIANAAAVSTPYQAWLQQQQQLGTYDMDYSKVAGLSNDLIQQGQRLGLTPEQTLSAVKSQQIAQNALSGMQDYGVAKYTLKPQVSETYTANPYGTAAYSHSLANTVPAIAGTILQPAAAPDYSTPEELSDKIEKMGQGVTAAETGYQSWLHQNGVTATSTNLNDPATKWHDAEGNDVTFAARRWLDLKKQATDAQTQLKQRQALAMKEAGYHITPELKAKAQKAAEAETYRITHAPLGSVSSYTAMDPDEVKKYAQKAYDAVLQGTPGYKRYQQILKADAQKDSLPVAITTFSSKALNQSVTDMFDNLNVNLGSGNSSLAANGVEWASGPNAGQQLSADDYEKMIGHARFAGAGIDTDGKYKMWFKVGDANINSKGKQVGGEILVKMDAYPGTAEALVKEGLATQAQQYLIQSMDQAVGSPAGQGSITVNGEGDQVHIRKVTPSEKAMGTVAPGVNYILSYPLTNGTYKQVPAASLDAAAENIAMTLSAKPKK